MIRTEEHIDPYDYISFIEDERGYIVWRNSTGNNIELLHIECSIPRQGYGTSLLRDMLSKISTGHVIYGFTRERLIHAQLFYQAKGFTLTVIPGLYCDGNGVMFRQSLTHLKVCNNVGN
jgi:hypothetical protein